MPPSPTRGPGSPWRRWSSPSLGASRDRGPDQANGAAPSAGRTYIGRGTTRGVRSNVTEPTLSSLSGEKSMYSLVRETRRWFIGLRCLGENAHKTASTRAGMVNFDGAFQGGVWGLVPQVKGWGRNACRMVPGYSQSSTSTPTPSGGVFSRQPRAAGLPGWRDITGHSGRVGMAQDLSAASFALPELMTAGRCKSPRMPDRYTERQAAGRGAVARYYQGGRG